MNSIFHGKKIIIGITASIAAYKSPLLVRELVKEGAEVHCVLTPSAVNLVSPLVLSNLSKNKVIIDMFAPENQTSGAWHIHLTHSADAMIIAPCSASTIGKIANGICDNALIALSIALPRNKPLLIAPAMDSDMLMHPAVQRNISILMNDGASIIPPAEGDLSSGLTGPGRLPDIPVLMEYIEKALSKTIPQQELKFKNAESASGIAEADNSVEAERINKRQSEPDKPQEDSYNEKLKKAMEMRVPSLEDVVNQDKWEAEYEFNKLKNKINPEEQPLKGKKALVTAGPTYEKIDEVRYIGNYSSGKMGFALAKAAYEAGAKVVLISGPSSLETPEGIERINSSSARDMQKIVSENFDSTDVLIMAAAVADFEIDKPFEGKLKKEEAGSEIQIRLTRTPDILKEMGYRKKPGQVIVGFALEASNMIENARRKLFEKNADIIVANSAVDEGSGFGGDDNIITLISRDGSEKTYPRMSKELCAKAILQKVVEAFKNKQND